MKIKSQKDFWSGLMFVVVGIVFAWGATNYSFGVAARPGPGYFPFGLGILLSLVGLLVLGIAWVAGNTKVLGRASPYVETLGYSITFVFHMIPAITETSTRLPLGAPLLPNAEAPELKAATGVLLLFYLIGAALQVRRIRARNAAQAVSLPGSAAA